MLLRRRWFWKLVAIYMAILIVPVLVAWIIISAPSLILWSSVVALIVAWYLFRSYRNWLAENRRTRNAGKG